jgi:hypothetical protein
VDAGHNHRIFFAFMVQVFHFLRKAARLAGMIQAENTSMRHWQDGTELASAGWNNAQNVASGLLRARGTRNFNP